MMQGVDLIRAERIRQVHSLGFNEKHDAKHGLPAMVELARCYVEQYQEYSGSVRDLVKAGAVIAAAIDLQNKEETYE